MKTLVRWLSFWIALSLLAGCNPPAGYAAGKRVGPATRSASAPAEGVRAKIVALAKKQTGIPYKFGGNSPSTGFDCSGYTLFVYKKAAGMELNRSAHDQARQGKRIRAPKPGDLVFFNINGKPNSHVGIFLGDGRFIHAPSSGKTIRVDELTNPYWSKTYLGARSVL